MTRLSVDSPPRTPAPPSPEPDAPTAVGGVARPEVRFRHAQDRWARWLTARDRNDDAARRRAYVLGSVIALGLLVWVFWTR